MVGFVSGSPKYTATTKSILKRDGYILENGRVVMDGAAAELSDNEDVKEFYLGLGGGARKSFRDVKHYRRRKRWLGWSCRKGSRKTALTLASVDRNETMLQPSVIQITTKIAVAGTKLWVALMNFTMI